MKRFRLSIVLAIVAAFLLNVVSVHADTPDPDADPNVVQINVYRNDREAGDMLFFIYANIPYASIPDLPVTQTFIWSIRDTADINELGSTTGYVYNDSGYGYNLFSLYFSASDVTDKGMVWGSAFKIRLAGNPFAFDTPPVYNSTISGGDYSSLTDTDDVKAEVAARVLSIADDLNNKWGLTVSESLLTEVEAGTVLSLNGEAFFRGAVFGLQSLAPAAFAVAIRGLDLDDRAWEDDYTENLTGQWGGTWADTAQAAGKALFGTDYDLLSIIMLLGMGGLLLYGNIMLTGDSWNAMIDVSVLAVIGARLGMYGLGFLILAAALAWIYIGSKVWFRMLR